jgi:oligosaccharide repeat unit polymerase
MFIYLIPPLAGVIMGRRKRYGIFQLIAVALGALFVFFYGFTSGTRNLLASYLVTFLIGYAFALPKERRKEIVPACIACAVILFVSTTIMLRFRNVGFKDWMKNGPPNGAPDEKSLFVDYNLWAITQLVEVFPAKHDYLGWEVPYLALIRPIPRAIWPSKPEGMSLSIEDALGTEGMTVAASFAGEAYMAGGMIAVLACGIFFGAATGWWSHLSSPKNSEMGLLIYASGFFAAVISMRSLFVFTTALMPTVAGTVIAIYLVRFLTARVARLAKRLRARARPISRPPPLRGRPQR